MNDSGFLRDLARTAREEEAEEQQRWDRWDRLTDGALSPEEEAELRALDDRAFQAFRPLDSDFRDRMVDTIGLLVKRNALEPAPGPVPQPAPRPTPQPLPRPPLFWRRPVFLGPGLAAAAALLLVVRSLIQPEPALDFKVARALPGVAERRGDEEAGVLVAGGTFDTSATPEAAISVEIEPRCYVKPKVPPTQIRTADCAASERAGNGSLKIHGSLPKDLPAGSATLVIVLAASGNQPSADKIEELPTDHPTKEKTWFAGPQPIEILAP